ncbi:MAG: hypothetical protein IJX86_12940 [Lachnospiraceae bacterium]|nr:hypothetical protein [Lachnospiraceae bacterium]
MIYLYTEDKNEGLALAQNAVNIYLGKYNIVVGTIDGIKNLANHISNLSLNIEDFVYYVYDDIPENADVQKHIKNARKVIGRSNFKNQIHLISIFCCEHSILTAVEIEKFSHPDIIKTIFAVQEYTDLKNITAMTKSNSVFDKFYDRARKERERTLKSIQKKNGLVYTQNDIESGVSAEKLFKGIFKDAFTAELNITTLLGKCWEQDCCFKKNRVCSMNINNRVLCGTEKKQFLVDRTVYIKVVQLIAKEQNLQLSIVQRLNLDDIKLSKKAIQIVNDFKAESHKCMLRCRQHIRQFIIDSGETGRNDNEIINYCTGAGFTEKQAKKALEFIVKQAKGNNK